MEKKQTVFVGLSGGVDSSVAAARLLREGYDVTGVFIKVWQPDFIRCDWQRERLDAMRVAAALNIPFLTCDAEQAYKQGVADYMITEYKAGRTPNPDVMCNKKVKFGVFLDFARKNGANLIATGHHARIVNEKGTYTLRRGIDSSKDQSYFLWTLKQELLPEILFPIGNTQKEDVRTEAKEAGLPTHSKPDSQGICFLGAIDIKEFLSHYVETTEGDVVDENGVVVGIHDGALYYTIGQRHGFRVTRTDAATRPHYVISKDLDRNLLVVSTTPPHTEAEAHITLRDVNRIGESWSNRMLLAQCRYRQRPFEVRVAKEQKDSTVLTLQEDAEKPSTGQSCVLYDNDICVGGGIIE